jgi:hypothetical protein
VTRLLGLGLDAALVYSPTGTRAARRGKDFGIRREDEDVGGLPEATGSPLMRSGSHKALTPPCQSVPYRAAGERHGSERDHRRRDWHLGAQTQRGEALGLPGARTSTHASTRNGRGRTARAGVEEVSSTGHGCRSSHRPHVGAAKPLPAAGQGTLVTRTGSIKFDV